MYIPKHFSAPGEEALRALIRAYPFATLITTSAHGDESDHGLEVNHLPLYLEDNSVLSGHVARANPFWQSVGRFSWAADVCEPGMVSQQSEDWHGGADLELCGGACQGQIARDGGCPLVARPFGCAYRATGNGI